MLNCIILDDYQDAALRAADWSTLSSRVSVSSINDYIGDQDELVARISDADILVIMRERTPFPAVLFDRLPKLRLLITSGMRNASIDMESARRHGVTVCGTGTQASPPMELTWALILGLARSVVHESNQVRKGLWQSTVGVDLAGATLGIIGLGKIGGRVAEVAKAFGMNVIAWSENLTQDHASAVGAKLAPSKEALLADSDFVTIHLVLSERTRGLIGTSELRQMRKDAFLINTSRAGIVDTNALVSALREKWISGAGLDVFDTEPLPVDSPLRSLSSVLALPHLGYVSRRNYAMFFGEAVENIEAWLSGSPMRVMA